MDKKQLLNGSVNLLLRYEQYKKKRNESKILLEKETEAAIKAAEEKIAEIKKFIAGNELSYEYVLLINNFVNARNIEVEPDVLAVAIYQALK